MPTHYATGRNGDIAPRTARARMLSNGALCVEIHSRGKRRSKRAPVAIVMSPSNWRKLMHAASAAMAETNQTEE